MEQIQCTLSFNQDTSQVSINGIDGESLAIGYSNDIDFTPLVRLLSEKIEDEKEIVLKCDLSDESQTDKEKILIETLKKIINSFNQNFSEVIDIQTTTTVSSDEKESEPDDLPF